jgi:carbonic anhydrase/acetyltransferase-like protein (isoleucine patch superfamily)
MTELRGTGRAGVFAFEGKEPRIADGVFIAPGAIVIGDVEIGPGSSVWFNAVIRADCNSVRIGARTNLQDGAIVHVDPDAPCVIGDDVTIGHGAIVHGTTLGDRCLIGMGAIILSRSELENEVLVAAGAVVPEDARIPGGVLVAGVPAKVKRELDAGNRGSLALGAEHYDDYRKRHISGLSVVKGSGNAD